MRVDDVGDDRLLVHDEHRADPSLAFALSRLAEHPDTPTPVGVFRAVERPSYEVEMQRQLVDAAERSGPGDLASPAAVRAHLDRQLEPSHLPGRALAVRRGSRARRATTTADRCAADIVASSG